MKAWNSVTFTSAVKSTKRIKKVMWDKLSFFADTTERMCWTIVHLLFLTTLSCISGSKDKTKLTVSCPEYQRDFGGSCYEFVDLQHTFFSAQAWCEQRGGHLGLIPDKETQYFLQILLNAKKDVWVGMAPLPSTNLQYSPTVEGKKNTIWNKGKC